MARHYANGFESAAQVSPENPPGSGSRPTTEVPERDRETLRLAGGAMVSLIGKVGGRLVQVVAQVVFARWLGMAEFGRFSLGLTVLRLLSVIAPLGLHRSAVVFGAKYWKQDEARFRGVVGESLGLALVSGMAFALGLAALAPWLSEHAFQSAIEADTLRAFALAVPFVTVLRVAADLGRVSQRMEYGTLAEDLAQPAVSLAVFLALFATGNGLAVAVGATAFAYVVAAALAVGALFALFPGSLTAKGPVRWNPSELVVFSAPTSLAILCGAFTSMLDRLVVGRYCPPEQMAVYQAASQVSVAFTIIIGSFTTIFAPMAARFIAAGDKDGLSKLLRTSTKWGLYLGLPLFLVVAAVPGHILALTFGGAYSTGAVALLILATGQIINVGTGNVGILLVTAGLQTSWLALTLTATLVNGTIGVLLVERYGILGAAVGNLLATMILFGGGVTLVYLRLGLWAYDRGTLKLLASSGIAFVAGRLAVAWMAGAAPLVTLAFVGAVVPAVFASASWIFGFDADDRELFAAVVRRVRPGRAPAMREP